MKLDTEDFKDSSIFLTIKIVFLFFTPLIALYVMFNFIGKDEFISSKSSPDNKYVISHLRSRSENSYAPYGTILVLSSGVVSNAKNGHVIFGGFCNKNIEYTWVNSSTVDITCETSTEEALYTASKIAWGKSINIKIVKRPNKPLRAQPASALASPAGAALQHDAGGSAP